MRRIVTILLLLLFVTLVGTVGLRIIEGNDWLDCLFMAVITLTTVGYEDVVDLSPPGKIFIIAYLVVGLGRLHVQCLPVGSVGRQCRVAPHFWRDVEWTRPSIR